MKKVLVFFLSALLCLAAVPAQATVTPIATNTSVSLSLTINSSASISCTPSSVTFAPNGTASGTISCTFTWNVGPGYQFVDFAAYLAGGATAALTGPGGAVLASAVSSSNDAAAPVTCTQTVPAGPLGASNAGCYVLVPSTPNGTAATGTMTHTFLLSIATAGLAAGTYTGSLTVAADIQ